MKCHPPKAPTACSRACRARKPHGDVSGVVLERFQSSCALVGIVQCVIYFHPTDEDLPVGTPGRKMTLWSIASWV